MSFEERLKPFIARIDNLKANILTEEATKTSLIMPFFQILGYDVFNPTEFIPEFTADVGIKKGEKVDYAICLNDQLTILIEAKSVNEALDKHDSQLFRYFGTTKAKFAILTNGINYKFYTDLDETNKMDSSPFFDIDLTNINDTQILELKKFCKENFDLSQILDTASELKYLGLIKKVLKNEFASPSDNFVRFILGQESFDGIKKTQNVIDKYKPIVRKSLTQYINDLVNDKIQNALKKDDYIPVEVEPAKDEDIVVCDEIITTAEELQSFYIVKSMLGKEVSMDRINHKDTLSYFGIILDNKVTKWICRVYIKESISYIIIPINGQQVKYNLETVDDIYKYSEEILGRLHELLTQ